MTKLATTLTLNRVVFTLGLLLSGVGTALAQDGAAHEGMTTLVLFLGIAGIIGVYVIRWSQSTSDEDEQV